jgi:hypothetical protein
MVDLPCSVVYILKCELCNKNKKYKILQKGRKLSLFFQKFLAFMVDLVHIYRVN